MELFIVRKKEIQNIILEEFKKEKITVNTELSKIKNNNRNVILYHSGLATGYDFSFVNNLHFVGFEEDFFQTNEGKQLIGRFNRITPVIL